MSKKNQEEFTNINGVLLLVYFLIFFMLSVLMGSAAEKAYGIKLMNQTARIRSIG